MGWDGVLTHRVSEVFTYWLEEQWNQPSRSDHYLMQIALDVHRGRVKDPNKVKFESKKITFSKKKQSNMEDPHEGVLQSKLRWAQRFRDKKLIARLHQEIKEYKDRKSIDTQEIKDKEDES